MLVVIGIDNVEQYNTEKVPLDLMKLSLFYNRLNKIQNDVCNIPQLIKLWLVILFGTI